MCLEPSSPITYPACSTPDHSTSSPTRGPTGFRGGRAVGRSCGRVPRISRAQTSRTMEKRPGFRSPELSVASGFDSKTDGTHALSRPLAVVYVLLFDIVCHSRTIWHRYRHFPIARLPRPSEKSIWELGTNHPRQRYEMQKRTCILFQRLARCCIFLCF
jgi:hypothetical protein